MLDPDNPYSEIVLPPYGQMSTLYTERIRLRPVVPPDWQVKPGCDTACRLAEWNRFKAATVALISEVLWPVFDHATNTWVGKSASTMNDLTRADLEVLTDIRTRPVLPLDTIPVHHARAINCPSHRQFFLEEDDDNKAFLDMYAFYDRTLDDKLVKAFPDVCGDGLGRKVSSASLQFKTYFQRPRPYQTAVLFNFTAFTWENALSSLTPSLSCGHCLQGILGVATIMERIILLGIPFSADSWEALEQHAVDLGDRRVMAGVHYPADNLSSWIIALRMAPHVFRSPEVAVHIWRAISQRSFVYQEMVAKAKTPGGEPYRGPLDALHTVAMENVRLWSSDGLAAAAR